LDRAMAPSLRHFAPFIGAKYNAFCSLHAVRPASHRAPSRLVIASRGKISVQAGGPLSKSPLIRHVRLAACDMHRSVLRTVPLLHICPVHRSSVSSSPPNQRHEEARDLTFGAERRHGPAECRGGRGGSRGNQQLNEILSVDYRSLRRPITQTGAQRLREVRRIEMLRPAQSWRRPITGLRAIR
jgi:hypothetical protein